MELRPVCAPTDTAAKQLHGTVVATLFWRLIGCRAYSLFACLDGRSSEKTWAASLRYCW